MLDCGRGALGTLARLGLSWQETSHLLLTHFHTDHVGEVAPLLFALKHGLDEPRTSPLRILGPRGTEGFLESLAAAHGDYVLNPGFPVEILEMAPGDSASLGGTNHRMEPGGPGLDLRTRDTRHTEGSLALRVEGPAGSVGFTGDTGPVPGLGAFFRGCRLLVAECSHPDGWEMETHLTPSELAGLAEEVQPELLVPVHTYPPLDPAALPDLLGRAGYGGQVRTGTDGLTVELLPGELRVADAFGEGGV